MLRASRPEFFLDERSGAACSCADTVSNARNDSGPSQKAFANIVAPFDGVVTARNIDIGSYVTGIGALPLFVVADVSRMRVYVRAPEIYAAALKNGMDAKLRLPEYAGQEFDARIDTTAHAIGAKSRSLRGGADGRKQGRSSAARLLQAGLVRASA